MTRSEGMEKKEFLAILAMLGLSVREVAEYLGVNIRTVKRWTEGGAEIPKAPAAAMRAWLRLDKAQFPWRPDSVSLDFMTAEERSEQMKLHGQEAVRLDSILERVRARGGPASPWRVDLSQQVAELNGMRLYFYHASGGGFSPSSYTRADRDPDIQRDMLLLEDAIYCIAEAIGKEEEAGEFSLFVTEDAVRLHGLQKKHRILEVCIDDLDARPGWAIVDGFLWDPTGEEDEDHEVAPLRPQLGEVRTNLIRSVVQKRARQLQVKYIILRDGRGA